MLLDFLQPAPPDQSARWDAARTHRLNTSRWALAKGHHINTDINAHLETLINRCRDEYARNPILKAVGKIFANDVVGPAGPELQVQSDNEAFNREVEDMWAEYYAHPDVNGLLSGPSRLRMNIELKIHSGGSLSQMLVVQDSATPVNFRVREIDVTRLAEDRPRNDLFMGVKFDPATGRPLGYSVRNFDVEGNHTGYTPIDAKDVIHQYELDEPDQLRGIPLFSTCLETCMEVRMYDQAVLDIATNAAQFGVLGSQKLEMGMNEDDSLANLPASGEYELPRKSFRSLPPNYEMFMVRPDQPSTRYLEHRLARLQEIGLALRMPLIVMLADASRSNYSSARFDDKGYDRRVKAEQWNIQHDDLTPQLRRVVNSWITSRNDTAPERWKANWTWPRRPHVDRDKESRADERLVKFGGMTVGDVAAENGVSQEQHFAKLDREITHFRSKGWKHPLDADMVGEDSEQTNRKQDQDDTEDSQ